MQRITDMSEGVIDSTGFARLRALKCSGALAFVSDAIRLCEPEKVFVVTDSSEDRSRVRRGAIERGEEEELVMPGHTVHFDGYYDQGRDTNSTRYLVPEREQFEPSLNQVDREQGLCEVRGLLRGSMRGREMIVRFFSLAPPDSPYSIMTMQITDSYYVAHSLDLLYRPAYGEFCRPDMDNSFFKVLHSTGRLERGVSVDVDKRRVYIDYTDNAVYSVNTQYAGNTVGLKKLAFRLAIRKADRENWLAEHMFIMGVQGPGGRKTYFTGAYPSGCGKTSTSMTVGETIVGDDLAYIRRFGQEVRTANVECGIFGIIRGVSAVDDPIIFSSLTTPGEIIFSNVLVHDGVPYWLQDGRTPPLTGRNYAGEWHEGMIGPDGVPVPMAHRNARYTMMLNRLPNLDPLADDPMGVPLSGIIYGGRDSDTNVPVRESFSWEHGVICIGASLESESTAATIGKEGVMQFQPFANRDFISIPLGRYVKNHLTFARGLERPPRVFGVNYFLKDDRGEYLNEKDNKRVWLKWMELRVHGDVEALRSPVGWLPKYSDLERLFGSVLNREYSKQSYTTQFTIRTTKLLEKIQRIESIYRTQASETPDLLFRVLQEERERLERARAELGDNIPPSAFV
ncbi:MAG: phosphoenolpyruvate carboxykinase (GTP) [Candidatus Thorarchaeota archaeon]|nr:phosphoenolpyruvate carboxykinase (GTP) [Candidatus Thorarchaeota archaeon]